MTLAACLQPLKISANCTYLHCTGTHVCVHSHNDMMHMGTHTHTHTRVGGKHLFKPGWSPSSPGTLGGWRGAPQ